MVINKQIIERADKIAKIKGVIKNNKDIDKDELLMQIQSNLQVSERKAKEYLEVAEWELRNG